MPQNMYDNPTFFAEYSKLARSAGGLANAPEWVTLREMLPDIAGKRVVDLGCGFGYFCRWAAEEGAANVLGIDLSENMLLRAAINTSHPKVSYRRSAIEDLDLPPGSFDLVFSSLTLHYVESFDRVCDAVARLLAAGGAFVFSVEHPIYTASWSPTWEHDAEGRAYWPLNRYLDEGSRVTDWLAPGVIKQHRTVSSYVNGLIGAGFRLTLLQEWGPSARQIEEHPEWALERERPMFMLVSAALEDLSKTGPA